MELNGPNFVMNWVRFETDNSTTIFFKVTFDWTEIWTAYVYILLDQNRLRYENLQSVFL